MFSITLLCMGKLKEKFYTAAAEEYSKRDNADGGSFNQSQGYAQSFNQVPQQQPAYQAPQNVSAASSDFSMLSDDDPELPF